MNEYKSVCDFNEMLEEVYGFGFEENGLFDLEMFVGSDDCVLYIDDDDNYIVEVRGSAYIIVERFEGLKFVVKEVF